MRRTPRSNPQAVPAIVAAALFIAGCGGLAAPVADAPSMRVLDVRPAAGGAAVAPSARTQVIEVSTVRASPGYDSAAIVYVERPHALERFATHRWVDPPAAMIGPLVVRALDESGAFKAVVHGPAGVSADLRLDIELTRLQQSFVDRPSRVELTLRLQLVELAARRIVATRTVDVAAPAAADNPDGGVAAANAALADALGRIVEFCRTESAGGALRPGR
ncbi:MAG: ABC-type transport auxiliary lipoprotein family protein [Burkholderiales bacterium]